MHDPLGFVMYAFPWGEKGSPLEDKEGPDEWQIKVLTEIGEKLRSGSLDGTYDAIQYAIASGHGVGKSAMVAWLIEWAMATCEDTRGVVTANTETQLKTKTWPELAKWHRMAITSFMFELTATAIFSKDPEHERTWRIDMVPWSEKNTEAFAGLHNEGKRILVIFDEGSAIPNIIWETTEGALTDSGTEIIWVVCGNPTRNTGRFRECFESLKHRWSHVQVDSRTVRITNKTQIDNWVADYGEDSDFVRVRVRGVFPRAGAMQLIPTDIVDAAMAGDHVQVSLYDPLALGVDVARFGDDESVMYARKGRDGRTHNDSVNRKWRFRGIDTMELAAKVALFNSALSPDGVFIDGGGVGGGVVDRCRQLKLPVIEVNFGAKPDNISTNEEHDKAYNKRAEMWLNMRRWLKNGGKIPNDPDLKRQLIQQTYEFRTIRGGDAIILTSKEAMKLDGLESPDIADALALTFAHPIAVNLDKYGGGEHRAGKKGNTTDYDPLALAEAEFARNN